MRWTTDEPNIKWQIKVIVIRRYESQLQLGKCVWLCVFLKKRKNFNQCICTCTDACECLDDHPLVFKGTGGCLQDGQKDLPKKHLEQHGGEETNWWEVETDWMNEKTYFGVLLEETSAGCYRYFTFCTSICIFRWTLKWESKVRKMAKESSKTSGTDETPFLESATHRYCLMALTNISWVRNTGPAPCSTDSNSCKETIFDRNSWDLQRSRGGGIKGRRNTGTRQG